MDVSGLRLQIHQQYAKLGMDSKKASLDIQQPRADLQINSTPAKMQITQGPGELRVDSEEARAALGMKSVSRMNEDIASQSRQVGLEAIGTIAEEGNQLAQIEKGNTIADIALQRSQQGPMPIDDVAPTAQVQVRYTAYPFDIQWTIQKPEITWTLHSPDISYNPGALNVYVSQRNQLDIEVKGQYMNMQF